MIENYFYYQLAKSIQAWLRVEQEIYFIYSEIMEGANPHLISVTFHGIESFESKLVLIDSCLALIFNKDSEDWKRWRSLQNKARKLNGKRNKIVHQPVHVGVSDDVRSVEISPSFFNAQALAKGQTSYNGPVIDPYYKPSLAKIKDDHKIDLEKLSKFEIEFIQFAEDLRKYKNEIQPKLTATHESVKKTKNSR